MVDSINRAQAALRAPAKADKNAQAEAGRGRSLGGQPQAESGAGSPAQLSTEALAQVKVDIEQLKMEFERFGVELQMEPQNGMDPAVVRVTDKETGELIRQVPTKEWLELRKNLAEGRGLILDEFA